MTEKVETLHGLMLTESQVIITVTSNGCTGKEDFKIELKESQPPIATFIRVQPDYCRAVAHSVDIAFSLKEVGAAEFTLDNPFEPGPIRLGRTDVTTLAIGEEGQATTLAVGEEGSPPVTTLAVGEEGSPPVTTLAVGEEGQATTLAIGEETSPVTQGRGTPFGAF
ncbi:MAG: hypothetical protein OEU26_12965 [Candidatus Tectomicrobia bacterium]|nr:hypothetical protein [Candidatus Tectomicrobia bacterium]